MKRVFGVFVLSLVVVSSLISVSCKKNKEDNSLLYIFGSSLLNQPSSTCENKSGFVICIPPGLRQ